MGKVILQCMHIQMKHRLQKHPLSALGFVSRLLQAIAFINAGFTLCVGLLNSKLLQRMVKQ